jgi:Bax protein
MPIATVRSLTRLSLYAATAALPLLLAVWLVREAPKPVPPMAPRPMIMTTFELPSVELLEAWFAEQRYGWPPPRAVPAIALKCLPDGFGELEPTRRKELFLRMLLPIALAEVRLLREERRFIEDAFARGELDAAVEPGRSIVTLLAAYRVAGDVNDPRAREILLRRVDEVPVGLVLAQAANESGWGTSRFAREANNLFGVWTWDEDAGLTPTRRRKGQTHLVRAYEDLRASVRSYLHNLNAGHAYVELRRLRAEMRARGAALDPLALAAGLGPYSQRGDDYVAEIRGMIAVNGLDALVGVALEDEAQRLAGDERPPR